MKSKVTRVNSGEFIGIYINSILHLKVPQKSMVHSWFDGQKNRTYYIEITSPLGQITVFHYNKAIWRNILKFLSV